MPLPHSDPDELPSRLSEATGLPLMGRGRHVKPPGTACIERLSLRLDGDVVLLSTFPAELQNQARAFYGDPSRVARILELTSSQEWLVRPNGHLSYWLAAPERRWYFRHGSLDVEQYLRQWREDLDHVHSYARDAIATELWPWLVRRRYAGEADRAAMEDFLARSRPQAHLRPGAWVSRRWSLAEARQLQADGKLIGAVRHAVDTVLATLGEPALAR